MERNHEERIRDLEDQQLVDKTEKRYQQQTEEQNRQRRTELVAWLALLVGLSSIIVTVVDKVA